MPYATKLLGQAQALTDINQNPYQPYQGQRKVKGRTGPLGRDDLAVHGQQLAIGRKGQLLDDVAFLKAGPELPRSAHPTPQ
jgi:hypothetical protein